MGFLTDDSGGGNVSPIDVIDTGYVLTPGEDYQYVSGGGGPINMPYFPSTSIPFYVPPTPTFSQQSTSSNSIDEYGKEVWAYVMIAVMAMIMVIVLAVVL